MPEPYQDSASAPGATGGQRSGHAAEAAETPQSHGEWRQGGPEGPAGEPQSPGFPQDAHGFAPQQDPGAGQPPQPGPQTPLYAPETPYNSQGPYAPGRQPGRPGGAQEAPSGVPMPPGAVQSPYDWRVPGHPQPPYTGPQAPPNMQGAPQEPHAAQGPAAEPQAPPGERRNPYQIPGYPPAGPPQVPQHPQGAPGAPQGPPPPAYQPPPAGQQPPQGGQQHSYPPHAPYGGQPHYPGGGQGAPLQQPAQGFQYHSHFPGNQSAAQEQGQFETADALDADSLVRGRRQTPTSGWRKIVHSATLGLVKPGLSSAEMRRRELTQRASTHVAGGHHRVAVLSLKGGVGKTTTTVALGSTLASLRGDRVLAVDANPDRGTLSDKVRLETAATIRDLLNERNHITRYADIRGFTSQSSSRLEILASDRDPAVSEAFSENDYREVTRILEHFYSICITDCGTGLLHSAMRGVLGLADQIVLVSSASVDGARSASATLDWLEAHEYGYHVRGAVVVLSMVRQDGKSSVDLDRLEEHFASRCRAVVRVPWDAHLEEGAEVDLDRLAPSTRDAYLQLAATVGEAFAWPR
uniref:MinD/ParA family ATP-binding protein n=1 Tax=Allosalinactinospora lopnorensis TaxID=1352348 RepID=UPI00373FCB53